MFEWLDVVSVHLLFEFTDVVLLVLEHLFQVWIVSSFPFCLPGETHEIYFWYDLSVYIFEMQDVSSILRNVLNMTVNVMDRGTSELKLLGHFLNVDIRVLRDLLMLFHAVNPDIYVSIFLFSRELPQRDTLLLALLPFKFRTLLTESLVVLGSSHLEGFVVMV